MTRISGRWIGIGIAVLVVVVFAIVALNGNSRPQPQATVTPVYTEGGATATAQPPATLTTTKVPGMSIGSAGGLVLKFGVVAAILAASLWAMRRFTGAGARTSSRTNAIAIADTIMVGQGRALYVVDVGDRAVLIGGTPQQFTTLADITDAALLEKLRTQPEKPALALNGLTSRLETAIRGFNNARVAAQAARATARATAIDDAHDSAHALRRPRPTPASFAETLGAVGDTPDFELTAPPDPTEAPTGRLRRVRAPRSEENTIPAFTPEAITPDTTERLRALSERLRAVRESA